uniref:RING-type domain-containing protein n=1 Tax=viral metagenome TaxID=1070528 RepID=A0A6C0F984_9ZZZZ|tara:strand:+ start:229 stop:612 length:384 start_codon:yes stop_codon:yes gene_type:complete
MNSEECPICWGKIDDVVQTPLYFNCNHIFHDECIKQWKGTCPCCRAYKRPYKAFSLFSEIIAKYDLIMVTCYRDIMYIGVFYNVFIYDDEIYVHVEHVERYRNGILWNSCNNAFNINLDLITDIQQI